ncbi:MAG TPA: ABC transporter permease, partial [Ktedonobacteraceae bacterium]|nr:ABC transporter permease [Ktedonobacteraceae bacterium]
MRYLFNSDNYDLTDPGSIPNLLVQHLYFVGVAMLVSLVIAIPLGILVTRYRSLYLPVLGIADLLYSIPGIALIAILIPIPAIGIGPLAIIIPLVLYTQVALIRNTAAAINGIDPLLLEVG